MQGDAKPCKALLGTGPHPDGVGARRNRAGLVLDHAGLVRNHAGLVRNHAGLVLDGAGLVLDRAGLVLDRAGLVLDRAGLVLDRAGLVLDRAGLVLDGAGLVLDRAGLVLEGAEGPDEVPMRLGLGAERACTPSGPHPDLNRTAPKARRGSTVPVERSRTVPVQAWLPLAIAGAPLHPPCPLPLASERKGIRTSTGPYPDRAEGATGASMASQ
jgi:hypothetical protein